MNQPAPPTIFSPSRRLAQAQRARQLRQREGAARYLIDEMIEDLDERLGFLRHHPVTVLLIGSGLQPLAMQLAKEGAVVTVLDPAAGFDQEQPFTLDSFDLVASLGTLHNANDLPGALIHIRNALRPGGLAIASFVGAGSLQGLREAMLAADGDRPAPRLHPAVDVRAAGQLLQRVGWGDPVVDSRSLSARFSSLGSLVADLRAQGLSNCLANPGPALTRSQHAIAREQFGTGRIEQFEILTLTGWKR